jgi:hypothetical protein
MAIINQGILGGLSGKVGQVIGASWRGINYLRIYAVPSNPQTAAQTLQRTKFSHCVALAKSVLSTICNKFWENMFPQMSGFNALVKKNLPLCEEDGTLGVSNVISAGSLECINLSAGTYNPGTGAVSCTFSPVCTGNGLASDKVVIVVYDRFERFSYVNDTGVLRSAGTITAALPAGLTAADLLAFAFVYRGTAPNYEIANSSSWQLAAV